MTPEEFESHRSTAEALRKAAVVIKDTEAQFCLIDVTTAAGRAFHDNLAAAGIHRGTIVGNGTHYLRVATEHEQMAEIAAHEQRRIDAMMQGTEYPTTSTIKTP